MNSFKITICLLFLGAMTIIGCADNAKDKIRQEAKEALPETTAAPITASGPAAGVLHYTCPNNCDGSGGAAAGTCPVCGTAYAHNAAFHANDATNTPTIPPVPGAQPVPGAPPGAPANPNPAQNAAGAWHYTCSAGCAGGAAAAGACGSCGGELAHNTAYHDN